MLDAPALDRLALRYVERYATTRARLRRYLERKAWERGWGEDDGPSAQSQAASIANVVERMAQMGYVDDRVFAEQRAAALTRRGFGARRISAALRDAGIAADDLPAEAEDAEEIALSSAIAFARRRRLGPFATDPGDMIAKRRAFAAMVRAGHPIDIVRHIFETKSDAPIEGFKR